VGEKIFTMVFRPQINDQIKIGNETYSFTEHPSAKGMPYGQSGRRATVYQVSNHSKQFRALKVFSPAFRSPNTEEQADILARYSTLPGLIACKRIVISPYENSRLISNYPDLTYSVLMPWLKGTTWQEVVMNRQFITKDRTSSIAERFLTILATMESNGIAHCDLSGPNLIINLDTSYSNNGHNQLLLIDLEDLYANNLKRPDRLPAGSAGYAHKSVKKGIWSSFADRFSGAVLLANILAWSNATIRECAYGEQYFSDDELQENCDRYEKIVNILERETNSQITTLFKRAWSSSSLEECPSFSEWSNALNLTIPQMSVVDVKPTLYEMPKVMTEGPVSGWRSISGENSGYSIVPGEHKDNRPKTAADYYYEFLEWDQIQNQMKSGSYNNSTSPTKNRPTHYELNKDTYQPNDQEKVENFGEIIFWLAVFGGLVALMFFLSY